MTKVMYDGPYPEVELPLSSSRTEVVKQGETVDVDPEIAKNLIEQGTWAEPKSPRKKEED